MMLTLVLVAAGVLVMLWLLRVPRSLLALSALAMGGGGLASSLLQPSHDNPLRRTTAGSPPPRSTAAERQAFTGQFTAGESWLGMADALASRGSTEQAAGVLIAAVREHPRDYSLWIGLGNALVDHSGGLTPGSRMAFDTARRLAPGYPAPRYFIGVAEERSGNVAEARRWWTAMLADAPADASWRPLVEDRLAQTAPTGPRTN